MPEHPGTLYVVATDREARATTVALIGKMLTLLYHPEDPARVEAILRNPRSFPHQMNVTFGSAALRGIDFGALGYAGGYFADPATYGVTVGVKF